MARKDKMVVAPVTENSEPVVASQDGFADMAEAAAPEAAPVAQEEEDNWSIEVAGDTWTKAELLGMRSGRLGDLVEDALRESSDEGDAGEASLDTINDARSAERDAIKESYKAALKKELAEFDAVTEQLLDAARVPSAAERALELYRLTFPKEAAVRFPARSRGHGPEGRPHGAIRDAVILAVGGAGDSGIYGTVIVKSLLAAGIVNEGDSATRPGRFVNAYKQYLRAEGHVGGRGKKATGEITYFLTEKGQELYAELIAPPAEQAAA